MLCCAERKSDRNVAGLFFPPPVHIIMLLAICQTVKRCHRSMSQHRGVIYGSRTRASAFVTRIVLPLSTRDLLVEGGGGAIEPATLRGEEGKKPVYLLPSSVPQHPRTTDCINFYQASPKKYKVELAFAGFDTIRRLSTFHQQPSGRVYSGGMLGHCSFMCA